MADRQPWQRLTGESAKAHAAFRVYMQMPPRERSIDAAWRADSQQTDSGKRAHPSWFRWSSDYEWVKRAAAYDQHLAEQDEQLWEERRRQLREQDWSNSQEARDIIMAALPEASRFIERQERFVRGGNGAPDQLIITENFNIMGLMRALTDASKLQRLTVNEPTENINNLSGAALDAAVERVANQLAGMAHGGETQAAGAPAGDGANADK